MVYAVEPGSPSCLTCSFTDCKPTVKGFTLVRASAVSAAAAVDQLDQCRGSPQQLRPKFSHDRLLAWLAVSFFGPASRTACQCNPVLRLLRVRVPARDMHLARVLCKQVATTWLEPGKAEESLRPDAMGCPGLQWPRASPCICMQGALKWLTAKQ